MADVLIKGMEMPTGYDKIGLIVSSDGNVKVYENAMMTRQTQAVSLPEHGRLIDVDRFMDDNVDGFGMNWDNEEGATIGRMFAPFAPVKKALDKAPTVIEASKERKK